MPRLIRASIIGAALVAASVAATRARPSAVRPAPGAAYQAAAESLPPAAEPLPSPAGAESSAPQLTTGGNRAILSWMERDGQRAMLKFAVRTPSGWSPARTVVSASDLVVNEA